MSAVREGSHQDLLLIRVDAIDLVGVSKYQPNKCLVPQVPVAAKVADLGTQSGL